MQKIYVGVFALALCLVVAATAQSVSREKPNDDRFTDDVDDEAPVARGALDFDYQFGIVDRGGDARYVGRIATLGSGERFTVRLRSRSSVYAYLFVSNPDGGFSLITPESDSRDEAAGTLAAGQRWVTLPDERAVMRLDDKRGIERVYVVVAARRVAEIERLADDRDPEVDEAWLIALRSRVGGRGQWTRQYGDTFVRANGSLGLAVEDASFTHR